jgi:hypothetical protein
MKNEEKSKNLNVIKEVQHFQHEQAHPTKQKTILAKGRTKGPHSKKSSSHLSNIPSQHRQSRVDFNNSNSNIKDYNNISSSKIVSQFYSNAHNNNDNSVKVNTNHFYSNVNVNSNIQPGHGHGSSKEISLSTKPRPLHSRNNLNVKSVSQFHNQSVFAKSRVSMNNLSRVIKSLHEQPSKLDDIISLFQFLVAESNKIFDKFCEVDYIIKDFREITDYNTSLLDMVNEMISKVESKQKCFIKDTLEYDNSLL